MGQGGQSVLKIGVVCDAGLSAEENAGAFARRLDF